MSLSHQMEKDVQLIKTEIKRQTEYARLCRILRRQPQNRPEKYRDTQWPDFAVQRSILDGRTLCALMSHYYGHINAKNLHKDLKEQAIWLEDSISRLIRGDGTKWDESVKEAAERMMKSVQWRLQRQPYPQRHCRHRTDFNVTKARCCYCDGPADPSTVCPAPPDPSPLI